MNPVALFSPGHGWRVQIVTFFSTSPKPTDVLLNCTFTLGHPSIAARTVLRKNAFLERPTSRKHCGNLFFPVVMASQYAISPPILAADLSKILFISSKWALLMILNSIKESKQEK